MQLHRQTDEVLQFKRPVAVNENRGALRLVQSRTSIAEYEDEGYDQEWALKCDNYTISLGDSLAKQNEVSALIKRMYSWRGYNIESPAVTSRSQTTLEAFLGRDLVGTLTLGLDSKQGLLADELYNEEINALRRKGRKICELSKLAIDPKSSSKELLASLFNLAYICGRIIRGGTDFIIEINPRHAGYYKRVLGFRQISETRVCQRVNAPAVLLHLELDYVDAQVSRLAGLHEQRERSLYSHFLPKHEETKVATRASWMLSRLAGKQGVGWPTT